jgi:MFS family permease
MNEVKRKLNESAVMRWSMLALISVIMFATYYINDIFSGLKGILEVQLGITSTHYGMLAGSVGVFNTIGMIIVGGLILDKLGVRRTGVVFVGIATLGSFLMAYGGSEAFANGGFGFKFMNSIFPNYSAQLKMMILGRLLFGLGLETCCVLVQKIIVRWFKGKELALAFAVNMSIGRFGSAFAIMLGPILAGSMVNKMYPQLPNALWFGFGLAAIAMLAFLVYITFDLKFDKNLAEIGESEEENANVADKKETQELSPQENSVKPGLIAWIKSTNLFRLMTNKSFLYIAALCVTFYSAVFPFIQYATDMLVNKFGFETRAASKVAGFLPIGAIVFTIIFGRIVDKKGKSASLMLVGSLLLIFAHLTLSLTQLPPYFALFALGVAYSLVPAAMWPSVAKIVEEERLGLAYALMFTIQNWGLMLFPFLIGKVLEMSNKGVTPEMIAAKEATYNYTNPILMLACLGLIGMVFAFLLKREDKVSGYGLELPSGEKG